MTSSLGRSLSVGLSHISLALFVLLSETNPGGLYSGGGSGGGGSRRVSITAEARPHQDDLYGEYTRFCRNVPSHNRLDALAYYENANLLGVFYNDKYWELRFLPTKLPVIVRPPVDTRQFFDVTGCRFRGDYDCLSPDPSRQGGRPWVDTVHVVRDRVYILYPPGSAPNAPRVMYTFRYDPAVAGSTPQFLSQSQPEEVLPVFARSYFSNPGLTATFTTVDLDDPRERVVWTNERISDKSLKIWGQNDLTAGGSPRFVFDLVDADGNVKSADLIWALDTFDQIGTNDPAGREPGSSVLNFRRFRFLGAGESFSYAIAFRLSRRGTTWEFQRIPELVWDIGVFMGCPPSYCLDATMDGVATNGAGGSWSGLIWRGRYVYRLQNGRPDQFRYPLLDGGSLDAVDSVRSLFGPTVAAGDEPYFDAVFSVPGDNREHVYLVRGDRWWRYDWTGQDFPTGQAASSGRLDDLFVGMTARPLNIDSVFYHPSDQRVFIFTDERTWECSLTSAAGSVDHRFGNCAGPTRGRPPGFRQRINAVLTHRTLDEALFFSGPFFWRVNITSGLDWFSPAAPYRVELVHAIENRSAAVLPFFERTASSGCNYDNTYRVGNTPRFTVQDVWGYLSNFLSEDTEETLRPLAKAEGGEVDEAKSSTLWILLLILALLVIIAIIIFFVTRRRRDENLTNFNLSSRASVRSRMSVADKSAIAS